MIKFDDAELEDKFAQASPSPVLSSDSEGQLQFVNPAASKIMHDVEVAHAEEMLPTDHKGLVKACLKTGVTLTEECQLGDRNIVWLYRSIEKNDLVYIYGYDVTAYHLQQPYSKSLPEANPNPVLTYNSEGKVIFKNSALLKLLDELGLVDIEDVLPFNHVKLAEFCFKTGTPVTEERLTGGRSVVWSYKFLDNSEDLCIYGYEITAYKTSKNNGKGLPDINPSPVLTADSDGVLQFTNNAASQLLLDFQLERVKDMLPADHEGMVKACLLTNTPLTAQNQICGKTLAWSYLPVDGSDVIYIYGHDITDYCLNPF